MNLESQVITKSKLNGTDNMFLVFKLFLEIFFENFFKGSPFFVLIVDTEQELHRFLAVNVFVY